MIIGLRPVRYFTEARLHGHMGICVLAARIVRPDKPELVLSRAGRFTSSVGSASNTSTPPERPAR